MRVGGGLARASVVVGREVELETLRRAVRSAREGETTCVFLVGEGGIGKTRLLAEASALGRQLELAVLSGRAPLATPVAFSVVADGLRSWLRGHQPPGPMSPFDRGLALVLPEWPVPERSAELDAAQLRLLALEGVVRLVRQIASTGNGAVLLLDDLHDADPESLELVRYLTNAAIDGLSIIGTMRPSESAPADELLRSLRRDGVVDVVTVVGLTERSVGDLVAALLDARPPDPLVADIVARSDGVPLLVEEVLLAHVRAGTIENDDGGMVWRGGVAAVPATIRDLVEARLGALDPVHRNVLVAGAVVGDFDPSLMTAVAAADDAIVTDALAAGVRAGVLETAGGVIAFRHAIIREAVLDATVPHLIDTMHRRAAVALATGPTDANLLERRARHLTAVNERDEAAGALASAAERRLDEYALLAAEQAARAAVELAHSPPTKAMAVDALSRTLAAQGRWADALQLDTVTVAEHGETPERRLRMATSALEAGRSEEAGAIIARALAAGDESPLLDLTAGRAAVVGGDAKHALDCAQRVLGAGSDTTDLDARLNALELQGRALDFLGDRAGAQAAWTQQADEAQAAGRTQAQLRAVVQLGKVELFAGERPNQLHVAVELARDAGALVELSWAEENLAIALALHGDLAAGQAVLVDAINRCRELRLDQLAYLLVPHAVMASYVTDDDVGDILDEAEALAPTPDLRLHSSSVRADIAMRRGRYAEAVEHYEECVEIMRAMPGIVPNDAPCWIVWALAAAGRADDAARALEEARRGLTWPGGTAGPWCWRRPRACWPATKTRSTPPSRRQARCRWTSRSCASSRATSSTGRRGSAGCGRRWTSTKPRVRPFRPTGCATRSGRPEVPSPAAARRRNRCLTSSPRPA